jgi:hypothetical protein
MRVIACVGCARVRAFACGEAELVLNDGRLQLLQHGKASVRLVWNLQNRQTC